MNSDESPFEPSIAEANEAMLAGSIAKRVTYASYAARGAWNRLTEPLGMSVAVPPEMCTAIMQQAFSFAWREFTDLERR